VEKACNVKNVAFEQNDVLQDTLEDAAVLLLASQCWDAPLSAGTFLSVLFLALQC
ncbi:hypothetical protein T484DRAFT_1796940, partial [Baffinella frigidus]